MGCQILDFLNNQNKFYEFFFDKKKFMYFYREGRGLEIPYESAFKSEFSV